VSHPTLLSHIRPSAGAASLNEKEAKDRLLRFPGLPIDLQRHSMTPPLPVLF